MIVEKKARGGYKERELIWIYGLLALLEKPLLPDQAGDLCSLLNSLLK